MPGYVPAVGDTVRFTDAFLDAVADQDHPFSKFRGRALYVAEVVERIGWLEFVLWESPEGPTITWRAATDGAGCATVGGGVIPLFSPWDGAAPRQGASCPLCGGVGERGFTSFYCASPKCPNGRK